MPVILLRQAAVHGEVAVVEAVTAAVADIAADQGVEDTAAGEDMEAGGINTYVWVNPTRDVHNLPNYPTYL